MFAYSYEQWHSPRFRVLQAREWQIANRTGVRREAPLDERILANGPLRLYHQVERLAEEAAILRTLRYRMHVIDASRFTTTGTFHSKVRLMLEDRGVYQESLDGFADALLALPFSTFGRAALVFQHFDVFARQCGALATQVLDCVGLYANHQVRQGRRLLVLLQADSPTFELGMLEGACPASQSTASSSAPPQSGERERVRARAIDFDGEHDDAEDTLVEMRLAR